MSELVLAWAQVMAFVLKPMLLLLMLLLKLVELILDDIHIALWLASACLHKVGYKSLLLEVELSMVLHELVVHVVLLFSLESRISLPFLSSLSQVHLSQASIILLSLVSWVQVLQLEI